MTGGNIGHDWREAGKDRERGRDVPDIPTSHWHSGPPLVIPVSTGIQCLFPLRNVLGAGRPRAFRWIPAKACGNDRRGRLRA